MIQRWADEDASKVKPFIAEKGIPYPILLDPGRKVNELFRIEGIPKSFVYDRNGELVASYMAVRNAGGEVKLLNLTKHVRDVIQITRLFTIFDVQSDEAIALRSFQPH